MLDCTDVKPFVCGNRMPVTLVFCYAFSLVTLMGEELSNTDTAMSTAGTDGLRAFEREDTIICLDSDGHEVEVPFHAVKKFKSHIITEVEGEGQEVLPTSRCLDTYLYAPRRYEGV